MTPNEIKAARNKLGLTQRGLESALNMSDRGGRSIRAWEGGEYNITGPCALLLRIFLKHGILK